MAKMNLNQLVSQGQQLQQQQKQRLIVSQKHQQAIKLLQQPVYDVSQWLTEKLQENPLLEIEENRDAEVEKESDEETPGLEDEINWEQLLNRGDEGYHFNSRRGSSEQRSPEEQFRTMAEQSESLQDSLRWQINLLNLSENKQELADYLVSYINEDGYFQGDLEEIAAEENIDIKEVEKVLEIIQNLDPPGVGGRTLQEVLLLQLEEMDIELPGVTGEIISNHLEALKKRSFKKIAKKVDSTPEVVQEVADLVHQLEPRPGRVYEEFNRQYIIPDVVIREVNDNYAIILNDSELPPLRINARYRAMLESGDPELEEYVKEKLSGALWVLNCIYQRQQTMYKVVKSIAEHQNNFFDEGVRALKPLVLKEIADDVGVHESTVSRAVRNKYVQTKRGLYPLKFFFSPGIKTRSGEEVAATAVKALISDIVENEDKINPLSDRAIMEKLEEEGVNIGRRTISKYRQQLEIPAWNLRKRVETE